MGREPDGLSIVQLHDTTLARRGWPDDAPEPVMPGAWCWIHANHRYNSLLWHQEDKARRADLSSAEIVNSQRLIERYKQRRNDAVESIDEALLAQLPDVALAADARLSSETPGAMIDRLSILALKIHHLRKQAARTEAGPAHVETCLARLKRLQTQRHDLACCLDQLLQESRQGRAYFKLYRQFKIDNDPAFNSYPNAAGSTAR